MHFSHQPVLNVCPPCAASLPGARQRGSALRVLWPPGQAPVKGYPGLRRRQSENVVQNLQKLVAAGPVPAAVTTAGFDVVIRCGECMPRRYLGDDVGLPLKVGLDGPIPDQSLAWKSLTHPLGHGSPLTA